MSSCPHVYNQTVCPCTPRPSLFQTTPPPFKQQPPPLNYPPPPCCCLVGGGRDLSGQGSKTTPPPLCLNPPPPLCLNSPPIPPLSARSGRSRRFSIDFEVTDPPQIKRHLGLRTTGQLFPITQQENYCDWPIPKWGCLIGGGLLHTPIN